jgi:homocysteine S-methyltransferase
MDLINSKTLVFDGAMGSMIYNEGIYINQCFDALNMVNPDIIFKIHQAYCKAGVDIIETNTYGANQYRLKPFGLYEKIEEINRLGVELARKAADEASRQVLIAGSLGPLGKRLEPLGSLSTAKAAAAFKKQASYLVKYNCDLIICETFSDLKELETAVAAIREITDLPIVAQLSINDDLCTSAGTEPAEFTGRMNAMDADVIGLNCSVGPQTMLEALEKMVPHTDKPLSLQPNAGKPKAVEGRKMFLCSPEYLAEYAKRFIQTGASIVGGCCGTTPDHMAAVVSAVKALNAPAAARIKNSSQAPAQNKLKSESSVNKQASLDTAAPEETPLTEKSSLGKALSQGKFIVSVEIIPPKGSTAKSKIKAVNMFKDFGVDVVNIPDSPRAAARMSCLALSVLISNNTSMEPVMHYCCRDRNLLGMQSDLLGAYALGIHNLLLITGDPPKIGPYPSATAVFDIDSIGLVKAVKRLNQGIDLAGKKTGKSRTAFVIGVGANPGAIDLDLEIERLELKYEAGAEFIMTQPVFDPDILFNFLERTKNIKLPVIAGVWPLISYKNAEFMNNEVPGASVPPEIMKKMKKAGSSQEQLATGIEIAKQSITAIAPYVQGIAVSVPLNNIAATMDVLSVLPGFNLHIPV